MYGSSTPKTSYYKLQSALGGVATYDYDMNAALSFQSSAPFRAGVNCLPSGHILNFNASVSSSIDPTYHRQAGTPPTRVADAPDGSGNIHANTVNLAPGSLFSNPTLNVRYAANVSGDWSPNSQYHWYSQLSGASDQGTFTLDSDPPFPFPDYNDIRNAQYITYNHDDADKEDRIDLHLTDKAAGYDTRVDYYLKFHKKYEDWAKTSSVLHPVNFVHGAMNPEWTYVTHLQNTGSSPLVLVLGQEVDLELSMTGEIGGTQSLDPEGIASFEFNEKITLGLKVTAKATATQTITVPPYTLYHVFAAMSYEDRGGTTSVWDTHGYVGDLPWHGRYVSPVISLSTDSIPLPQPAPSTPPLSAKPVVGASTVSKP